jgi:pyruvate/2-oxoglutarate/acetoin dehydrogenase E1 component
VKYREAACEALRRALRADEDVYLIGVDIGRVGGPFRVTAGLWEEFGSRRIIDTPIAEMGLMGLAVGSAMAGLRPIVELMYVDFIGVCLDPLLNQAAKARFMSGGHARVPMVVRTQFGAGGRAGAQHSQSLEGMLALIPGLKVVCPATVADAYGLLAAAIEDPDPVIVIENRRLYGRKDEALRLEDLEPTPIGRARIARPGTDVTCVTYSRMVHVCVEAANALAARGGPSIEVVDLRTIYPWDRELVEASVGRTSRLVVAHEAPGEFGVGAEISAWVAESKLFELDAPILRVTPPRQPVPFSPPLEDAYLVAEEDLVDAFVRSAAW